MKTKLIILLIILIQISCKEEKSKLERSWILVDQIEKPNADGYYVLRGLLVDFEDDQMTYSYITSKDVTTKKYLIEDNIIKYDTTTFGKIIHLSNDSLIIEADTNSFDMHFRPLEEFHFSQSEKQDVFNGLVEHSWSIETRKSNQIFYCDSTIYNRMPKIKNHVRCIVYETKSKNWKGISDYEWWTLKHFDNKLILGFSNGQTENAFFQMTNNDGQLIKGQYMDAFDENWTNVEFKKEKDYSSKELNAMRKKVIGEWEIEKVIEPNLKAIDSIEYNSELILESRTRTANDKIRITKTNLLESAINFSFKNSGAFQITANGKEIESGDLWELTTDGKYIKLAKGISGYNFIKILDLSENKMQILKKEMIDSEVQNGVKFFQAFLNFKLIKKEN